jgi:hypothetical protein
LVTQCEGYQSQAEYFGWKEPHFHPLKDLKGKVVSAPTAQLRLPSLIPYSDVLVKEPRINASVPAGTSTAAIKLASRGLRMGLEVGGGGSQ